MTRKERVNRFENGSRKKKDGEGHSLTNANFFFYRMSEYSTTQQRFQFDFALIMVIEPQHNLLTLI